MSVYQAALDGEEALKELLKTNVSINKADIDGNTALHYLCSYGKDEAVELLLKNKARVNLQNNRGDTALHRASSKGHKKIVSLLLGRGASVDIRNCDGQKPLQIAQRMKHKKVVKLLKSVNIKGVTRSGFGFIVDTVTSIFKHESAPIVPLNATAVNETTKSARSSPSSSRANTPDANGSAGRRTPSDRGGPSPGPSTGGGLGETVMNMLPSFLQSMFASDRDDVDSLPDDRSSIGASSFDINGNYEDTLTTGQKELLASQHQMRRERNESGDIGNDGLNSISHVTGPDDVCAFTDLPPETDADVVDAARSASLRHSQAVGEIEDESRVVPREGGVEIIDLSKPAADLGTAVFAVVSKSKKDVVNMKATTREGADSSPAPGVPKQRTKTNTAELTDAAADVGDAGSLVSDSSDEIHHGAANTLSMKGVSIKGEADPPDSCDASIESALPEDNSFMREKLAHEVSDDEELLEEELMAERLRKKQSSKAGEQSEESKEEEKKEGQERPLTPGGGACAGGGTGGAASADAGGTGEEQRGEHVHHENQEHHHHHHHHYREQDEAKEEQEDKEEEHHGLFSAFHLGGNPKDHPSYAFHAACTKATNDRGKKIGNEKKVKLMLMRGADVNILDRSRTSPLLAACMVGNEKVVEVLLQFGADPLIKNKRGMNARSWAIEEVEKENALFIVVDNSFLGRFRRWVVEPMVELFDRLKDSLKEIDVVKRAAATVTASATPAASGGDGKVEEAGKEQGDKTEKEGDDEDEPRVSVDSQVDASTSSKILDESATSMDDDAAGAVELSPEEQELQAIATAEGGAMPHIETGPRGCAHMVLNYKMTDFYRLRNAVLADSYNSDPNNQSDTSAVKKSAAPAVSRMQDVLSSGVNVNIKNIRDGSFETVLHIFSQYGNDRAVELLMRAGADPNMKTNAKDTCLHIACSYGTGKAMKGKGKVARMLLDYGADMHIPDAEGNTPLHFAAYHHRDGLLEILLELMVKEHKEKGTHLHVNVRNKKGETPLHKAAWNNKECAIATLLDHGADMNIRSARGRTALAMARINRHDVCAELLAETNDCWAIMNDPNSLCVGNHIVHHGDMQKLLNKFGIHRPVQLPALTRDNIIDIQKLMKPIEKRQWTRLLHTEVEKKGPNRNASVAPGMPPRPPVKQLTSHDWDQLLRLSNDRCQDCGDLLFPVKLKKHHVFVHDILKVTDSIEEVNKERLQKYTSTYCGDYIRTLNDAWFLLHNKHSLIEEKNSDNTFVYTVESVVEMLREMKIECGEDLVTLTDDDTMRLKEIMRMKAKKEFGRLIRRFKSHASYIAVPGVFTPARKAYIAKQSRRELGMDDDEEDEDDETSPASPIAQAAMAALAAVQVLP